MLSWPILTQDRPPDTQSTTKNRYQRMIAILWVWDAGLIRYSVPFPVEYGLDVEFQVAHHGVVQIDEFTVLFKQDSIATRETVASPSLSTGSVVE